MSITFRATLKTIPICLMSCEAVNAQSFEQEWLDDLSIQLLVQNDCAVRYFLNVSELENDTGLVYSARANCSDGRYFDAHRSEGEWGFTVDQCGVESC